jgi:F-type H+-transporting ATPase subunit delta
MAEALTIARPYAEAAFKLASDAKALPQWSEALERLAAVAADGASREIIGNPRLSDEQVATLFADVAGGLAPEQRNFVRLLAANERLSVLPEIASLFEAQKNASEGVLDARITSAYPLFAAQVDEVVSSLEARYGRKVKATVEVDADLIGGVSIRIGDEVIDASVRGKLAQLADALVK